MLGETVEPLTCQVMLKQPCLLSIEKLVWERTGVILFHACFNLTTKCLPFMAHEVHRPFWRYGNM
jgi:hypothetical protein